MMYNTALIACVNCKVIGRLRPCAYTDEILCLACAFKESGGSMHERLSKSIDEAVADITTQCIKLPCGITVTADPQVPPGEMWAVQMPSNAARLDSIIELIQQSQAMRAEIEADMHIDPLDVEYDGVKLRDLVSQRHCSDMEYAHPFGSIAASGHTPAQRAAVSTHWSAQLRAKVVASKAADRNVVTYCEED